MSAPRTETLQPSPSRAYTGTLLAIGIAILLVCVRIAYGEWFFGEDFLFLQQANEPRDWWSVFVPLEGRTWWSYRPLTIEVYFSVLHHYFGLNAFPYLLVSIAAQFGSGGLVWRIGRQLDLDRRVAMAAALMSVALYPSLNEELFWISAFQTFGSKLLYLATVTTFIDYLQRGGRGRLVVSIGAMLLALLAGEYALTLPGPLVLLAAYFHTGTLVERVRRAFRTAAPHVVLLALYLPFRYLLLGPAELAASGSYAPHLGIHMLRNIGGFLLFLAKGQPLLLSVFAATAALGGIAAWRSGPAARSRLIGLSWLFGGWLLAAMVPFLGSWFIHHRAASIMEPPFCLLLAAPLDAIARWAPARRAKLLEAGLVALLLLSIPYRELWLESAYPRGATSRDLFELIEEHRAEIRDGGCVDVVVRTGDEWPAGHLFALSFRARGLLLPVRPDVRLRMPPVGREKRRRMRCKDQFEIEVVPGPEAPVPTFAFRSLGARPTLRWNRPPPTGSSLSR